MYRAVHWVGPLVKEPTIMKWIAICTLQLGRTSYLVQGVQMMTRKRLCGIKGISEAKVDKIKVLSRSWRRLHYNDCLFSTVNRKLLENLL